jgi:polyisoprenoid-binding protein YceI
MSTHAADTVGTTSIKATRWRIDPIRSSVEFHAEAFWGMSTVKGRFSHYQGTLDLGARPAVELTVEADSVDTGNAKRDEHLRSPDFFAADRHPYVRFVSEEATLDGDRLMVRGRLHARGTSMPLSIEATLRTVDDELELEAATDADHRQIGMTWNLMGIIKAPSRLKVKGRLVRDAA